MVGFSSTQFCSCKEEICISVGFRQLAFYPLKGKSLRHKKQLSLNKLFILQGQEHRECNLKCNILSFEGNTMNFSNRTVGLTCSGPNISDLSEKPITLLVRGALPEISLGLTHGSFDLDLVLSPPNICQPLITKILQPLKIRISPSSLSFGSTWKFGQPIAGLENNEKTGKHDIVHCEVV
ncbi:hypothetical protein Pelo_4051 [Pelomyxa schiedti]|nr:hypothetical protein Pelo_4051 [Pelomyxa schiedti]